MKSDRKCRGQEKQNAPAEGFQMKLTLLVFVHLMQSTQKHVVAVGKGECVCHMYTIYLNMWVVTEERAWWVEIN